MKFLSLHIDGFGKFHDRSVSFEDSLNIIYGKNEAGKSTLHTFIRCMLFGLERGRGRASKNDLYSKYEPWQNCGTYGGQLRVEHNGRIYRIERNFNKEHKSFAIINETDGCAVPNPSELMKELLGGLTETTYTNTISIGQLKSATDGGMVTELHNYIANMNTSGNMALNITKAVAHLKGRRKELERQLVPEAARSYTAMLAEAKTIEREISAPEYENQLQLYQNMKVQVRDLLSQKQEEKEVLLQKISKGRQALSDAQFTDEASIQTYQNETEITYGEYKTAKSASEKKFRTVLAIALFLLTALFAGISALTAYNSSQIAKVLGNLTDTLSSLVGTPLTIGLSAAGALIVLSGGLALLLHGKRLKREAAMSSKLLQEVFSRHLGDSAISDEAMEAFEARMEEFKRLSQILVRLETSVKEQTAEISALQERESNCDHAISTQQRTQWELEKKLDHLTHCKDQIELLKHTLEENDRIREEITAIDLAIDTMTELSDTIRDSFGLYLNKTASDLISGITGGIYNSMSVDENLNIFMNTRTKLVPVQQVSSGTMDQIYLALRLAAAKLIQGDSAALPLIFDDSFVLYDDERLRTALKWLSEAYDGQIIIFTCHQREAQMLTANQISYHLIAM